MYQNSNTLIATIVLLFSSGYTLQVCYDILSLMIPTILDWCPAVILRYTVVYYYYMYVVKYLDIWEIIKDLCQDLSENKQHF